MTAKVFLPLATLLAASACSETPSLGQSELELSLIPRRGVTCAELGLGNQQLTLTAPAGGVHAIDAQNSVQLSYYDDSNTIFYFTQATLPITGVMAAIGGRTLVWEMPEGQTSYGSLHGPPSDGFIESPEEVTFCYDYQLRVQPSPYAHRAQQATWTLSKTGRSDALVLSEGQAELVEYDVKVSPSAAEAAGQYIDGPVFVQNASPHTVTVDAVSTMVGTIAAEVTCPSAPPFTMAPFAMVVCEFRADVPDTADRTVVGGATVSHGVQITTREVVASFASHTTSTTTIDDCVDVHDDAAPGDHLLGRVCRADGEQTFSFSAEVGPFACGAFAVTSTARYTGVDSGELADASWTVNGEVACSPGCTLSAAYWKNHSYFGPRRYNPTWDLLGTGGEARPFFGSGVSYIWAMWRPVQGNAYWTLARAYVATRLNQLNGAQLPAATQNAMTNATALFTGTSPSQVNQSTTVRRNFVKAAAALKDFNSGRTGPGRCTCKPDLDD